MRIGLEPFAVVDETGEDDNAEHQEKDEQRQFFSRRFKRVDLIYPSHRRGNQGAEGKRIMDSGETLSLIVIYLS